MAKKKTAKTSARASAAKKKPAGKRRIEAFDFPEAERLNNPPVGLVSADTDASPTKKTYRFDPHIDPELQFDRQGAVEAQLDEQISRLEAVVETLSGTGIPAGDSGSAGIPARDEALKEARDALAKLRKLRAPYLNWAGKAERTSFEVPSVSLHVHERIAPQRIIEEVKRRNGKPDRTFFESERKRSFAQEFDFYKHRNEWANRLIAGDSLLVMNSLLEKEGMAGQVQMIYIDPPYGIRYGSNFQPFVNKRDVKDRKDEDLTQEPEMIRAFRDTWELGIHSYLSYLRDRLLMARELLHESGSVFVQISDENLHHVRELLDETFGASNFIRLIAYSTTSGVPGNELSRTGDFILWFAKDKTSLKYRQLYWPKELGQDSASEYKWAIGVDGKTRTLTKQEWLGQKSLEPGEFAFRYGPLTSTGASIEGSKDFSFQGKSYSPGATNHWKTSHEGLERLAEIGMLLTRKNSLAWLMRLDFYPVTPINSNWADTKWGFDAGDKAYVVQTNQKVVQRCMLMTTDPGDLVLDPTCGSGTTAYVAEQWGRRWITCDTSRVAATLAKQRLMSADFDYYELAHPQQGVSGGFHYKTVPHITLKSIANNPEIKPGMTREQIDASIQKYADQETLFDQPFVEKGKVRVTGPFTVEAVPAQQVVAPDEVLREKKLANLDGKAALPGFEDPDKRNALGFTEEVTTSVARSGETLRQREWREALLASGIRAKGGQHIHFTRVESLPGLRWIQAEAETKEANPKRVLISFGAEHGPVDNNQVESAHLEVKRYVKPLPDILIFAGFQFDPDAAADIDNAPEGLGMQWLKVQMNTDLLTDDLKKKRSSNESFWLIGQPDVTLRHADSEECERYHGQMQAGKDKPATDADLWVVEVNGFDYYDPTKGEMRSGGSSQIAMWMLDASYDSRAVYPTQVFFPMAGAKEGWARLAKSLKAEVDDELIEAYRGTVSLPFAAKRGAQVAVKIIDDRGIESLKVMEVR